MKPMCLQQGAAAVRAGLGVALWAGALACATAWAQIDEGAAERLMKSSGLWEQLGSTAAGARAGIEAGSRMSATPLAPEDLKRLLAATDAAFAPEALRAAVRSALAQRVQPGHVAALNGWLDSEAGRRITALEVAAGMPGRDSDAMLRSGVARLTRGPDERRRLIEQMVQATRAAEAMTQTAVNVAVAVQRGISQARPDQPAPPVASLREAMANQRTQLLLMYAGMMQALFAEMYAPLSDPQLLDYLAFLRSEPGHGFTEATLGAVEQAMVQAAERLGERAPGARPAANT